MNYSWQVKHYQNVMTSNFEVITHKPYIQRNHIHVASAKQVFKNRTPIELTCTRLSQNVCCVKWTVSAIMGNSSNLQPLQYIHFTFKVVIFLLYMYNWNIGDYILSLKFTTNQCQITLLVVCNTL